MTDSHDDVIVTINDIRQAGFCVRTGAKPWLESRDVDFRKFLKEGLPVGWFRKNGDAQSEKACRVAIARSVKTDG